MLPRLIPPSIIALLAVVATPAPAQQPPSLPAVERTLTASGVASTPCKAVTRSGRGVAATTYRAPMSGWVNYKLRGRGDWDLQVLDGQRRGIGSSQGFGGQELVQGWVEAGQRVNVLACRNSRKAGGRATLSMQLFDVAPPKDAWVKSSLVRVFGGHEAIEQLEKQGLDVTHNHTADYADVLVAGDAQRALLTATGLRTETRIDDFDAYVTNSARADARALKSRGRAPTPTGRETYRTYDDIQAELKALAKNHPGRVKPVVIGKSYQGRELSGLEIANNVDGADGRPTYMVVALHHAREWPSAEAAMEFATMLARGGDARLEKVLNTTRTVVVPLINPDGYIASRSAAPYDPADNLRDNVYGSPEPNLDFGLLGGVPPSTAQSIAPPGGIFTYRRKNCAGGIPSPAVPCQLQYGIDPNRNYGEKWGGPGSSPDPTSQSFHGPGPWSEPETQAVHSFSQKRNPTMLITIHNVAALILRPPGTKDNGFAPDEKRLKEVGQQMADATGYKNQYGFELYDTTGTTEDWNYAQQAAYGYTIEMGPTDGAFHMPYEEGFIKEWQGYGKGAGRGMREALIIGAEAAANPADHGVITARAPAGRTLRVKKSFVTKTSSFCDLGYEPPVRFINPPLSMVTDPKCAGPIKEPISIPDGTEQTMTVPADGRVEWHVNPSIRPFVKAAEAYTFTCEDGGNVAFKQDIVVARGQRVDLGPICGGTADPGTPSLPGLPSLPGVSVPPVAGKAPAKAKKLTANQRRVLKRCLAQVNRTAKRRRWSSKRRASARKACERKAAKAPRSAKKKKAKRSR